MYFVLEKRRLTGIGWMDGGMEGWMDGWIRMHAYTIRSQRDYFMKIFLK